MQIFVKTSSSLPSYPTFLCSSSPNLIKPIFLPFFSISSSTTTTNNAESIINHLISTFGFSKTQAISASKRFSSKNLHNLDSVVNLFQEFGFSDTHIQKTVRVTPQILLADVEKILEPKLRFFEQLGITGSDLGQFISKNTTVLTNSLDRRLIPNVEILKNILSDEQDLIKILHRCRWVISKDPNLRLAPNISFLQSRGIVGSQLSTLLKRQPTLFLMKDSKLRELVGRVEEMGFGSRMLVHGLYTLSSMSHETLEKKFRVFKSFGFSQDDCISMLRRKPGLLRTSEEKLRLGMEFFMNVVGFEKSVLVNQPTCLMLGLEKRVIPRYRVFEILSSKKLLKQKLSFIYVIGLTEEEFLDRFISRFRGHAEELLVAYRCDELSDSSKEDDVSYVAEI